MAVHLSKNFELSFKNARISGQWLINLSMRPRKKITQFDDLLLAQTFILKCKYPLAGTRDFDDLLFLLFSSQLSHFNPLVLDTRIR